jgi:glutamate-1-semialdehyde 2,1-aminomutase
VILEPTGGSAGQVPVPESFLHGLREATADRDVLLIFDEVITGFRCSPGGMQGVCGITPDLTTMAKIVAGGFPGGAVGGRRDVLDLLDHAAAADAGREKIAHQGTFNANPISAAAGVATLGIVKQSDACERANRYAAELREGLAKIVRDESLPWIVYGTFSSFHIFTNPERDDVTADQIELGRYDWRRIKAASASPVAKELRLGLLTQGVDLAGWPGGLTSAVHTNDDLEATLSAFRDVARTIDS